MQKAFSFKNLLRHVFAVVTLTSLFLVSTGCSSQAAQTEPVKETKPAAAAMADKSGKTLVVYFSATGHTKKVAETIAKETGADLFEIKPEVPYKPEDLNWQNAKSRSTLEMKDPGSRPAIAEKVVNMSQYDVVFVGFPVWWYQEPSIINTFMESYDFKGKKVIPFATSGMSPIGDSGKNMQALAPGAAVAEGKRFPSNVSADELKEWAVKNSQ